MTMIGEDKSERLDVIPVQYRVIVTRHPKFACLRLAASVGNPPPGAGNRLGIRTSVITSRLTSAG
jgi:transposase